MNKYLNYYSMTIYKVYVAINFVMSSIILNKMKNLFLPLHRICHQGLQKKLLGQCQDGTKGPHPPQLVIFSPLKSMSGIKGIKTIMLLVFSKDTSGN